MSRKGFVRSAGITLVLAWGGVGCMSSGNKMEQSRVDQIQKGVTTRAEVEANLGAPDSVAIMPDGGRALMYNYYESKAQARNFIPYVSLFGSGADTRRQTLQVVVGPNNIVQDFEMTDRTGKQNYGLGYGGASFREQATPAGGK